jgi:hypothetical protein
MPRGRKKNPEHMTAVEELRSLLQWAERMQLENVAAALRRVLAKMLISAVHAMSLPFP